MRKHKLTAQHIERILEMYEEMLGPANTRFLDPEKMQREINAELLSAEYKVGSRWNLHSVLAFYEDDTGRLIVTSFPVPGGFDLPEEKAYDQAEAFENRVQKYLEQQDKDTEQRKLS